ncbi:hypothetical protein [Blastococcus brunescens]|uniref:Uncharacterized protein n=1 Tax=Blastococcus brunescens TaxID=1564165 RepID=A0ABZ1B5V6_9ACTN|nr:hypothetical protein [Blastococcus sp. BMG 8361]WRL66192.1 hypothetical protein U6N30_12300 [Blastococcus sp. BMG 8361]
MSTDQPGDLDRPAALAMWREYVATLPAPPLEEPAVERFGDGAALADELIGLVLAGTKRATAGLVADFAAEGSRSPDRRPLDPLRRSGCAAVRPPQRGAPPRPAGQRRRRVRLGRGRGRPHPRELARGARALLPADAAARGEEWSDELEVVFERLRVVWPLDVAD